MLHPCLIPACPVMLQPGVRYCSTHQHRADVQDRERRGTAAERGYGRDWQEATAGFLLAHPWCARCAREGRRRHSRVVGHIVSIRDDPSRRLDRANWEALCGSCNTTQAHEENEKPAATRAAVGEEQRWIVR
jgi:5-methylcytosine-specific restriction protein A